MSYRAANELVRQAVAVANEGLTFFSLPEVKSVAIFQNRGNEESITSESCFVRSNMAVHTSFPPDCAVGNY